MKFKNILFILLTCIILTFCQKPELKQQFQYIGYVEFYLDPEEYNKNGCHKTCKIVSFYLIDSAFNKLSLNGDDNQSINIKTKEGQYFQISKDNQQKIIEAANELKKLKEEYYEVDTSYEAKLYCGPSRLFFVQYKDTLKVIPVAHYNYEKAWDIYALNLKISDITNKREKRVLVDTLLSNKISTKACELMKHGIPKIVDDFKFFLPVIEDKDLLQQNNN